MKKIIVLGITAICLMLLYQCPHAMLNPGELVEGHQKLNDKCLSCHKPFWGISSDKCISCHKLTDIDKDKQGLTSSVSNSVMFHEHLSNQKCTSCHTDHKGLKPEMSLGNFTHEMLPVNIINNCNSCHGQPSDNLHKLLFGECNNCHNTEGWKSSVIFNHEMIQVDVKDNCFLCHKNPDDTFHSQIKDNCNKCHSSNQWKPSTFDHSAYFQLDSDHNVKCSTCHLNFNFSTFTCYGCHEHSESKILEEHNENGIYNFNNCASCHRSANEHDIRVDGNSKNELRRDELNNAKKFIKSKEKYIKKENEEKREHDVD